MPRLVCRCGAICIVSEETLRKRTGQRLRCRRCGERRLVPGSSPPAVLTSESTPASPASVPGDRRSGPWLVMLASLAVVVAAEVGLLLLLDSARESVAPVVQKAADRVRAASDGSIQGRNVVLDGLKVTDRLDELEQAAQQAQARPDDKRKSEGP